MKAVLKRGLSLRLCGLVLERGSNIELFYIAQTLHVWNICLH